MGAGVCIAVSTVLVVAMIAHALGVVLLILMRAHDDLHGLALHLAGLKRNTQSVLDVVTSLRITNWF